MPTYWPGLVVVAPAPAGPDHERGGVLGLGDDLLDPAAQLARGPQRVDQRQVVVRVERGGQPGPDLADAGPRDPLSDHACLSSCRGRIANCSVNSRSLECVKSLRLGAVDHLARSTTVGHGYDVKKSDERVARGALPRGVRRAAPGRHRARRSPASTPTPRPPASTAARRARPSCSGPTPSSTPAAGGRRFYPPLADTRRVHRGHARSA